MSQVALHKQERKKEQKLNKNPRFYNNNAQFLSKHQLNLKSLPSLNESKEFKIWIFG